MKLETAQKAAKWWADQLRGNAKIDNGDKSSTGAMTFIVAMMLQDAERQNRNGEQVDAFERELTASIAGLSDFEARWGLGVDYHPDHLLQEAAGRAGLDLGMASLPWKTHMRIENNRVYVACGYGAEMTELQ